MATGSAGSTETRPGQAAAPVLPQVLSIPSFGTQDNGAGLEIFVAALCRD